MCKFFSFVGDGYGNYLYSDWNTRKENLAEDHDSHNALTIVEAMEKGEVFEV